jgi:hypothetical protein
MLIDQMNRATSDFHAMSQSLVLRVETREGGEQGRVDIEDALWKLRYEPTAQQAHVAGKTNQVNAVFL